MKNNLNDWNTDDVINWVKSEVNLNEYDYNNFKLNELDGRDILDLTEDNLKYDLKIYKLHERKHFMRKICELLNSIVQNNSNEENVNKEDKNTNAKNKSDNKNNSLKYFEIIFRTETTNSLNNVNPKAKFKCSDNNKTSDFIREFLDIFNLSLEDKYVLLDKENVIIPKECFIKDFIDNDEVLTLKLVDGSSCGGQTGAGAGTGTGATINTNTNTNMSSSINNNNINNNNKQIQTHTHTNPNKSKISISNTNNNINKNYDIYNNNSHKNSFIYETANKNRYLSFEALDNYEKNGYTFTIRKNLKNSFDEINQEKEKVTINSYYNISNLNNFNNDNSFKSPFSSYENKSSNLLINSVSTINNNQHLNNLNNINKSSCKKKNKLSCVNIRTKKNIDFNDLSDNNEVSNERIPNSGNFIKIEDKSHEVNNEEQFDIDHYMNKFISYKNSASSINNQSGTSEQSKKLFDKKLNNYYMDAKKIKSNLIKLFLIFR